MAVFEVRRKGHLQNCSEVDEMMTLSVRLIKFQMRILWTCFHITT